MIQKLYSERILIIEDEDLIRFSLRSRLEHEGYLVEEADAGRPGLQRIQESPPDLILLDYRLPDIDGLSVMREVSVKYPGIVVILMTAYSTVQNAVEAMRLGAYTYLNKPFDMDELVVTVEKGLETTALRREVDRLRAGQGGEGQPLLIADSPAMLAVLETIKKVNSVGATTILLRGESGVGKDVIARAIHSTSSRAHRPFQNITCTALPDALLESELFGHEKGAFTDAHRRKDGLLELAHGGTVFLDEIGDMSLPLQAKVLRFLEERVFRRVGGTEDLGVDVRVICATNRDLEAAVKGGSFRQDLFYRISVLPLEIPALRNRVEDIAPLVRLFVERYNKDFKLSITGVSKEALAALEAYRWPGNVRELRNVIERAMILGNGRRLELSELPREMTEASEADASVRAPGSTTRLLDLPDGGLQFEDLERDLTIQALERTGFNQTQAARLLGMTRDQIRYRVEKFQLSPRGEADPP